MTWGKKWGVKNKFKVKNKSWKLLLKNNHSSSSLWIIRKIQVIFLIRDLRKKCWIGLAKWHQRKLKMLVKICWASKIHLWINLLLVKQLKDTRNDRNNLWLLRKYNNIKTDSENTTNLYLNDYKPKNMLEDNKYFHQIFSWK